MKKKKKKEEEEEKEETALTALCVNRKAEQTTAGEWPRGGHQYLKTLRKRRKWVVSHALFL